MPRRTPWPNRHEILFLLFGKMSRLWHDRTSHFIRHNVKSILFNHQKKGKYAWNNARDAIKTKFSAFGDISGFEHYQNKKMEKERRADIRTAQSELCMHMFSTYAFFACTGRNAWTSNRAITDTKEGNGSMAKEAKKPSRFMVFYHPNESQSFSLDDRYKLFFPVRLISARNDYIHLAEFKWKWFRPHFFFISLCRWMNSSVTRPWWAFVQWRTQHTHPERLREKEKNRTHRQRGSPHAIIDSHVCHCHLCVTAHAAFLLFSFAFFRRFIRWFTIFLAYPFHTLSLSGDGQSATACHLCEVLCVYLWICRMWARNANASHKTNGTVCVFEMLIDTKNTMARRLCAAQLINVNLLIETIQPSTRACWRMNVSVCMCSIVETWESKWNGIMKIECHLNWSRGTCSQMIY